MLRSDSFEETINNKIQEIVEEPLEFKEIQTKP